MVTKLSQLRQTCLKFNLPYVGNEPANDFKKASGEVPTIRTELLWQPPTNSRVGYLFEMCSILEKISGLPEGVRQNKHILVIAI